MHIRNTKQIPAKAYTIKQDSVEQKYRFVPIGTPKS